MTAGKPFLCQLFKTDCQTNDNYRKHTRGQAHAKNLLASLSTPQGSVSWKDGEYSCHVCIFTTTSATTFQEHVKGKTHTKKLSKWTAKPEEATKPPSSPRKTGKKARSSPRSDRTESESSSGSSLNESFGSTDSMQPRTVETIPFNRAVGESRDKGSTSLNGRQSTELDQTHADSTLQSNADSAREYSECSGQVTSSVGMPTEKSAVAEKTDEKQVASPIKDPLDDMSEQNLLAALGMAYRGDPIDTDSGALPPREMYLPRYCVSQRNIYLQDLDAAFLFDERDLFDMNKFVPDFEELLSGEENDGVTRVQSGRHVFVEGFMSSIYGDISWSDFQRQLKEICVPAMGQKIKWLVPSGKSKRNQNSSRMPETKECHVCLDRFPNPRALSDHTKALSHKLETVKSFSRSAIEKCLRKFPSHGIRIEPSGQFFCSMCSHTLKDLDKVMRHIALGSPHEKRLKGQAGSSKEEGKHKRTPQKPLVHESTPEGALAVSKATQSVTTPKTSTQNKPNARETEPDVKEVEQIAEPVSVRQGGGTKAGKQAPKKCTKKRQGKSTTEKAPATTKSASSVSRPGAATENKANTAETEPEVRVKKVFSEFAEANPFSVFQDDGTGAAKQVLKKRDTKRPEKRTTQISVWGSQPGAMPLRNGAVQSRSGGSKDKARTTASSSQTQICIICRKGIYTETYADHCNLFQHQLKAACKKGRDAVLQCLSANPKVRVTFSKNGRFFCQLCPKSFGDPQGILDHMKKPDESHVAQLKQLARGSPVEHRQATIRRYNPGRDMVPDYDDTVPAEITLSELYQPPRAQSAKKSARKAMIAKVVEQSSIRRVLQVIRKPQELFDISRDFPEITNSCATDEQSEQVIVPPYQPEPEDNPKPPTPTVEDQMRVKKILGDDQQSTANLGSKHSGISSENGYCTLCEKQCKSEADRKAHQNSAKHKRLVEQDSLLPWKFRPPPPKLSLDKMTFAEGSVRSESARSLEELYEWRERCLHRSLLRTLDKDNQAVKSYLDGIKREMFAAGRDTNVVSEEGCARMSVDVSPEATRVMTESSDVQHILWRVTIKSQASTKPPKAFLLHDDYRHFFSLSERQNGKPQQLLDSPSSATETSETSWSFYVTCRVVAPTGMLSQMLVLDAGTRPMHGLKLQVVCREGVEEERAAETPWWARRDLHLIPFEEESEDVRLERRRHETTYPPLRPAPHHWSLADRRALEGPGVCADNYVMRMHRLLQFEEMARTEIINKHGAFGSVTLELKGAVQIPQGPFFSAEPGTLFAEVPLAEALNSDSAYGQLFVQDVGSVLVKLNSENESITATYVARMVKKSGKFRYDAWQKDSFHIQLSGQMVRDMWLKSGGKLTASLQLRLDRTSFLRQHEALELLTKEQIDSYLFPAVSQAGPPLLNLGEEMTKLKVFQPPNEDQEKVYDFILEKKTKKKKKAGPRKLSPFVVYGPFGTGKTETLARAAIRLLRRNIETEKKKEKGCAKPILICTKNNSACDHFVETYFHRHRHQLGITEGKETSVVCRVYYTERRAHTISETVRKYCPTDPAKKRLRLPTLDEVKNSRVVLTTLSTSLELAKLGAKGCFSHILLDEASQAAETEAITPLTLADAQTRVVLAGDHHQTCPAVYSPVAREKGLGSSLMKRLFAFYCDQHPGMIPPPSSVLMKTNYRSSEPIVTCLSEAFYGSPSQLISKCPDVAPPHPLQVYFVNGRAEERDTSLINVEEGNVVIRIVEELLASSEIEDDGYLKVGEIAVVSQYSPQINIIRGMLSRKFRSYTGAKAYLRAGEKQIKFQPLNSLQGQEFETVILSLVETKASRASRDKTTSEEAMGDMTGFLDDPRYLNTALSRARFRVIVVGDETVMKDPRRKCHQEMSVFLRHSEKK